jgi:hypothetical protein
LAVVISALLLSARSALAQTDERLWIAAKVNGQPVRLAFDTGSSHLLLFRKGAVRLGLRVTNAPPDVKLNPGEVPMGRTEECRLAIEGDPEFTISFGVVDVPPVLDRVCDGLIGWGALSPSIIEINARAGVVNQLTNVPPEATTWLTLRIQTNANTLRLEVPGSKPFSIALDTGSPQGVQLSPPKWREWRTGHPYQPATEHADFVPASGLVVGDEVWANEISFGPLTLTEVPLMEASKTDVGLGGADYQATLGLTAMKRLDLILDGKKGIAYLRPRKSPPLPYQHNRLGAVFTPVSLEGGDLLAHVAQGSPADKAGIRNGDILLKIDDTDVTKWHSDPSILPLSRFWERPAGTKLQLTCKRGQNTVKISVVLADILGPDARRD